MPWVVRGKSFLGHRTIPAMGNPNSAGGSGEASFAIGHVGVTSEDQQNVRDCPADSDPAQRIGGSDPEA